MPLRRSSVATVSDGCAPCSSQWRARSSSTSISEGSVCGLYWPIVSIVRPSRGERLSATTIRQIGFFFEPTLLSLIRTAMRRRRLAPADLRTGCRGAAHLLGDLLRIGHLPGGHLLHQLRHLVELLDELVDGLDPRPGALGDPLAPRSVDQRRVGALSRRHREDDRLDPVELPLVDVGVLELLQRAHAGQHPDDVAEGAHPPHLAHLLEEVLERELLLLELLLEVDRLLLVDLLLGLLDQAQHVSHAEDPAGHPVGVEALELLEL